jgi:hypothetical protein
VRRRLLVPGSNELKPGLAPQAVYGVRDGIALIAGNPKNITYTLFDKTPYQDLCASHLRHFSNLPLPS